MLSLKISSMGSQLWKKQHYSCVCIHSNKQCYYSGILRENKQTQVKKVSHEVNNNFYRTVLQVFFLARDAFTLLRAYETEKYVMYQFIPQKTTAALHTPIDHIVYFDHKWT